MAAFTPKAAGYLRYVKDYELRIAGAESNLAIGVCKLGHSAGWMTRLGADELGAFIVNSVRAEGVDTRAVRHTGEYSTGLMIKQMRSASETSVFYYRANSAASHLRREDIDFDLLREAKVIHLTGITPALSRECEETVLEIADFANDNGIFLSFDPNIRRKLWGDRDFAPLLRRLTLQADIVMTGLDEGELLFGASGAEELAKCIFAGGRADFVAVKDGARGAFAATRERGVPIPPFPCAPVDPIGAGDAFDAAFLCGILEGRSIEVCGRMGGIAGAFATETCGDTEGYPSRETLDGIMAGRGQIYR